MDEMVIMFQNKRQFSFEKEAMARSRVWKMLPVAFY